MIVPAPVVLSVPAPSPSAYTLEAAFVLARNAARRPPDPRTVLSADGSTLEEKLAAINAIQSRLPRQNLAGRRAAIDALVAAAIGADQPPEVRARALTHLGYCVPMADDKKAQAKGVETLLSALQSPTYQIYALRGLGPASHGLPESHEEIFLTTLLDLLDTPVAGDERATAMVALYAFVSAREDAPKRKPALLALLDARFMTPIESAPEDFVRDPRGSEASREMAAAVLWSAARHRDSHGDKAALTRMREILARLAQSETSAEVLSWIELYRGAGPTQPLRIEGGDDGVAVRD